MPMPQTSPMTPFVAISGEISEMEALIPRLD